MFEDMLKKGFWASLFAGNTSSGRGKFTFEELRNLYEVLVRNQIVTEANKATVVETIRSIAEFMIWGDQNEPKIFEFFLENNILLYLHRMLAQHPANRSGDIAKQVLQTLSIIIQNIRSETGTFFLFSNNHINNIVEIRFDFEDEEVLGYYISFLKTISLKLNPKTVHFFLDERDGKLVFPLYTESLRFAHHKEGMVRAGVRTLTLNVYSVTEPYIQEFITGSMSAKYFDAMAMYLAEQVKILDRRFVAAQSFSPQVLSSLDSQIAEVEDVISYISDVLSTVHGDLARLVCDKLWRVLVGPYLLEPVLDHARIMALPSDPLMPDLAVEPRPVRAPSALYVLERFINIITYRPLLHNLVLALFGCEGLSPADQHTYSGASASCRTAVQELLRLQDRTIAPALLRLMVACVQNRHVAPEVLYAAGLVPRSRISDLHASCREDACAVCALQKSLQASHEAAAAAAHASHSSAAGTHSQEPAPATASISAAAASQQAGMAPAQRRFVDKAAIAASLISLDEDEDPPQPPGPTSTPNPLADSDGSSAAVAPASASEAEASTSGTAPRQEEQQTGAQQSALVSLSAYSTFPTMASGRSFLFHGFFAQQHEAQVVAERAAAAAEAARAAEEEAREAQALAAAAAAMEAEQAAQLQVQAAAGSMDAGTLHAQPEGLHDTPANAAGASTLSTVADVASSNASGVASGAGQATSAVEADLLGLGDELQTSALPTAEATASTSSSQPAAAPASPAAAASAAAATSSGPDVPQGDDSIVHGLVDGMFGRLLGVQHVGRVLIGGALTAQPLGEPNTDPLLGPLHIAAATGAAADLATAGAASAVGAAAAAAAADRLQPTAPLAPVRTGPEPAADQAQAVASRLAADADSSADGAIASTQADTEASREGSPGPGADTSALPTPMPGSPPLLQTLAGPPCMLHATRRTSAQRSEPLLDALTALLLMPLLPVPGLWNTGFLLTQLLPRDEQVESCGPHGTLHPPATSTPSSPHTTPAAQGGQGGQDIVSTSAAASVSTAGPSVSAAGSWACCLTAQQRAVLGQAWTAAASALLTEVGSMWGDALFQLLLLEWHAAYDGVQRPSLRPNAEVLVAGPHLYPPLQCGAGAADMRTRNEQGLSRSAVSALHTYHAVQRVAALAHTAALLRHGASHRDAPLPPKPAAGAPVQPIEPADGMTLQVGEGIAIGCFVSFSPGKEQRVFFGVHGSLLGRADELVAVPALLSGDADAVTVLAHSQPAVVLMEASMHKMYAGIVSASAPLMGVEATQDRQVAKWLHLHVRPSVRGLLRVLRSAAGRKGGLVAALRQLADGHWVLAFNDAESSGRAVAVAEGAANKLRTMYMEVLSPLLASPLE